MSGQQLRRSLSESDDFWDGVSSEFGDIGPIIPFIPPVPPETEFSSDDFHSGFPLFLYLNSFSRHPKGFPFVSFSPNGSNEWSDLDTPQRKLSPSTISSSSTSASACFISSPPRKYRKLQVEGNEAKMVSSGIPSFLKLGPLSSRSVKGEEKSTFPLLSTPRSLSPSPSAPSPLPSPSMTFLDETDLQMEMIERVVKKVEELENQVEEFFASSRSILHQLRSIVSAGWGEIHENAKVKEIQHIYHQMGLQIEEVRDQIKCAMKANVFSPAVLNIIRVLNSRLDSISSNLRVSDPGIYISLENDSPRSNSATLLLKDPPISQVLFKGKGMEDAFHLSLICNGDVIAEEIGVLEISFTHSVSSASSTSSKKTKTAKSLVTSEIDEVIVEGERGERGSERSGRGARIVKDFVVRNVHLNASTRMSVAPLSFSISLLLRSSSGKKSRVSLSSSTTHPIIAITNESQWMDAEYKLLIRDLFGGEDVLSSIDWCYFANIFHRRFLKATKQTSTEPSRPFSNADWRFFHEKFFQNCEVISSDQVFSFWKWFGPIMQTLRFKKHINSLWFSGILFGIVSKEYCHRHLESQRNGTFIVRFSEKFPGLFAIAYVCDDGKEGEGDGVGCHDRVKHYLVKPEDTGSQKSLPDFLHEKEQFKYLLRFDFRERQLECVEKDMALKGFYSKSRITPSVKQGDLGYQTQVY